MTDDTDDIARWPGGGAARPIAPLREERSMYPALRRVLNAYCGPGACVGSYADLLARARRSRPADDEIRDAKEELARLWADLCEPDAPSPRVGGSRRRRWLRSVRRGGHG